MGESAVLPASAHAVAKVLAVEDNPGDVVLVREMLDQFAPDAFELTAAGRLSQGLEHLLDGRFDVVLLDLSLPDADGLEALAQVRTVALHVPVVVLSGREDEALARRAVQEGAQDYLVKGQVDGRLLIRSITYAIDRKRAEADLAHQALHDGLTGLPNRALFMDRLGQALGRIERSTQAIAVLFCDLDRFKVVNDTLGHDRGDRLLVQVARRIDGVLRAGDTAARMGGDEFVVLCEDVTGETQAIAVAERLSAALAAPFGVGGDEVFVHTSVGIALATSARAAPETVVRDADAAMYRAKQRGGGGYEVFDDDMRVRAERRMEVQHALHRALEREELEVHYQPQLRLADGGLHGVEALVRWRHPERGLLPSSAFVGLAEETGLMASIGAWVLEQAVAQMARWHHDLGDDALQVAVNLSTRQCLHPELPGVVGAALQRTGLRPAALCLDVAETTVTDDLETVAGVLTSLKHLGPELALDDFGTGHASLRVLRRLPLDVVKIDRGSEPVIAAAVVSLARALGLRTIAEGIESPAEAERLREIGCDVGQGLHLGAPGLPGTIGHGL